MTNDATTGERQRLYRAGWYAISEQGEKSGTNDGHVFRSPEYRYQDEAEEDRREAERLSYVTEAWVEVAEWRRLDSPGPSDAERVEADPLPHESRDDRMVQCLCAWQEPTVGMCKCGHSDEDHDAGECWAQVGVRALLVARVRSEARTAVERVEAAHQRIHDMFGEPCRRPDNCTPRRIAYAALDVDDPTLTEMPWSAK